MIFFKFFEIFGFLTIFDNFWIFGVFDGFLDFFWIFWNFFGFFGFFLDFLDFFEFSIFLKKNDFLRFFEICPSVPKTGTDGQTCLSVPKLGTDGHPVTKVTTGHQKWPKMGQNSIIRSFFARRAKKASAEGRSPPQELEVSPRSGLYLLVYYKKKALF